MAFPLEGPEVAYEAPPDVAYEKHRELKKYTRELLRDHDALAKSLASAEEVAESRREEVERLTALAEALSEKQPPVVMEAGGNSYLFGELLRTRDRAQLAEAESQRLKVMLAMARDLRGVDVARRRAAASRALVAALENLRRRAAGVPRDEEEAKRRSSTASSAAARARSRLVSRLETAAEAATRSGRRRRRLKNGDGVARRLVEAVEAVLMHRIAARGYDGFVMEAAAATAVRRLATRRARERLEEEVLLCVARAKEARVASWLSRVGWSVGRLAVLELLNRGALGFALDALALEAGKSAGPAVGHYAHGATLLDVRAATRVVQALRRLEDVATFSLSHVAERARSLEATPPKLWAGVLKRAASAGSLLARHSFAATHLRVFSEDDDSSDEETPGHENAPSAAVLAALRRRGATSAANLVLEASAWRKAHLDRCLFGGGTSLVERRVRLRDGPEDHVVCWQWQSKSDRLRWSLEYDHGAVTDQDDDALFTLVPPDDDEDREDSSDDCGPEDKRWGGDLAPPEDDDDDETMSVVSRSPDRLAGFRLVRVPDLFLPAERVVGAERDLGPVRESWAVVPATARVSLRCELVSSRPLVRKRTARFRVAAVRATDFFDTYMRRAARSVELAAWTVAEEKSPPPDDAADFAARCQLTPKARPLFLSLQRNLLKRLEPPRNSFDLDGAVSDDDDDDASSSMGGGGGGGGSHNKKLSTLFVF